jgi:diguanylate cyclase (GGDEF)-like protein
MLGYQVGSRHRDETGVFIVYRRDQTPPIGPTADMLKLASDLTSFAVGHHQLTDALTFQAQHDTMTHLPNRALFGDRLAMALRLSKRWDKPVGVMLIDIDRFKYINDTYGHQAGDEMICQVALRLSEHLRSSDILARMGGDEFAIILNDLAKFDDVQYVAKSLVEAFKEPIELQGRKQYVTVSIGSAVYPRDASDSTSLLKSADLALYRAKDRGRDCAVAFSPEMGEGSVERMELESALRQALANNEMRLVYQPKVDASGAIVGLEALARWRHPTLGNVPPGKFIPIAEDTGVIVSIGTWVMHEAARQTRTWLAAGLPLIPVAVNVSTLQFSQPDFISIVSDTLANSGISGNWLQIELTESLLMGNTHDAMDKLAQLRDMNVQIAIDDFGTGYSSLSYLQRLSLDTLKVDRSFVMTIEDDTPPSQSQPQALARHATSGRIITRAVVALAKSLGLRVVAEGVETEAQRNFLLEIGCDQLQGYLFSPPKEADKIEPMVREQLSKLPLIAAKSA